ncbi:MAG: LSM domain-containing protein [Candidatus Hodarchaeota archaeon]
MKNKISLPLNLLEKKIGHKITVYLKTGFHYTGKLLKVDPLMNLALQNVCEQTTTNSRRLGKILIRGNNVLFIVI